MSEKTISRQEIRECLEALKQLPDFDRQVLPKSIHTEFHIPMTGYITRSLNDYLNSHYKTAMYPGSGVEVREPKDNIIRPMPEEIVPVDVITGTPDEIEKQLEEKSLLSKESNTIELQEYQAFSNFLVSDDDSNNAGAEPHHDVPEVPQEPHP